LTALERLIGLPPVALTTAPAVRRIELDRADAAVIKIDQTGKAVHFLPISLSNVYHPQDRIAAVTIERGSSEYNVRRAKALGGLLPDSLLTVTDSLVGREASAAAISAWIIVSVIRPNALLSDRISSPAFPEEIERISFGSALGIFDANHGHPAVSRIAKQFLPAPPVNSGKTEVAHICRHWPVALKPPPLRRLPGDVAQNSAIPTYFDFGYAIHDNFDRAFTSLGIAANPNVRPAGNSLCGDGPNSHRQRSYRQKQTYSHCYHLKYSLSTLGAISPSVE
jgi:hypothetical protein